MVRGLLFITAIVSAVCCHSTQAASLADHASDDALLYVEWCGQSKVGAGYSDSHLKTLLETSEIPKLVTTFVPRLADRVEKETPGSGAELIKAWTLVQSLWKRPTAIYVAARTSDDDAAPMRFELLCDAGDQIDAVRESFDAVAEACADGSTPLHVSTNGSIVSLANFENAGAIASPLSHADAFKKSIDAVGSSPITFTYVDHDRLLKLAESGVERSNNQELLKSWIAFRDALSLEEIHQIAIAGKLEGGNWINNCWINCDLPPSGFLSAFSAGDADADLLRAVPADARAVSLVRMNAGTLFARVRKTLAEVSPEKSAEFEKSLALLSLVSGTNVQTQFVDQLGTDWVTYMSPGVGGGDALATVVMNQPKDAKAFNRSMISLASAINSTIATQMKKKRSEVQLKIEPATRDDVDVNYWALPAVSPAWGLRDGRLYLTAFPQTTVAAARTPHDEKQSIVDADRFRTFRTQLGAGENLVAFAYYDLPEIVPTQYAALLEQARIPLGISDLFGVSTPAFVVPPLESLQQSMAPAGYAVWVRDDGLMVKTMSPFPGATLLTLPKSVQQLQPIFLQAFSQASKQQKQARIDSFEPDAMPGSEMPPDEPPSPPRRPLRPRPGPRPTE